MPLASLTFDSIRARPGRAQLRAPGRCADRHHHGLAAHPDRTRDRGRHRRAELPRALHREDDEIPGPGAARSRRHAQGPARARRSSCTTLARKSLHFVGYEGLSMIAVSGLDMAAWDALAKAAGMPLCVLLGGSVGPVKAYNSNGLWLKEPRPSRRRRSSCATKAASPASSCGSAASAPRDDLATIEAVRKARRRRHGADGRLQPGPPSRRGPASAATRSTISASPGSRSRSSTTTSTATRSSPRELEHADPDRRELLRPARPAQGAAAEGVRLRDAGLHAHRRRHRRRERRAAGRHSRRWASTAVSPHHLMVSDGTSPAHPDGRPARRLTPG